jgi:hypothetical protein
MMAFRKSHVTWPVLRASFRTETLARILRTTSRTEVETRLILCFASIAEGTDPDNIRFPVVYLEAAVFWVLNLCRAPHPERGPPFCGTPAKAGAVRVFNFVERR